MAGPFGGEYTNRGRPAHSCIRVQFVDGFPSRAVRWSAQFARHLSRRGWRFVLLAEVNASVDNSPHMIGELQTPKLDAGESCAILGSGRILPHLVSPRLAPRVSAQSEQVAETRTPRRGSMPSRRGDAGTLRRERRAFLDFPCPHSIGALRPWRRSPRLDGSEWTLTTVNERTMKLSELLTALPHRTMWPGQQIQSALEVTGVTCDSRQVKLGNLFVAIPGAEVDGHSFIPHAVRRGAVALIGQRPVSSIFPQGPPIPYVPVISSREALALLSAAWHGYPARRLRVIGVTGTDGKTTTVHLIGAILQAAGYDVGLISTVSALVGGEEIDTGFHTTTPDAPAVQQYLARMVAQGSQYVIIEATSHGLAQHRVTGCEFDVAVITNITHEHLDYHGTYEEYRTAKARLFESLRTSYRKPDTPKVSILNADDSSYNLLEGLFAERSYSYGMERPSDVHALNIQFSSSGTSFTTVTPDEHFIVQTPLVGPFSVCNVLAAIAVCWSQNVPSEAIQHGVATMRGVRGRMERIELGQDFTVIIDFAHTPNALEKALETVRTMTRAKVIVVFGCAGLRDRTKRPMMGRTAGRLADYTFLTAEDPRTEDVNHIIGQIAVGCEQARRREGVDFWKVPDRSEAIAAAINKAERGDLVIVTGKGHERSMCFGTTEHPWSDHEAVKKALRARLSS